MGRLHYFDVDGNYGNADKITVVGTENWIKEDFLLAREAKDEERYLVARLISDWIAEGRDPDMYSDEFAKYGLKPHRTLPPAPEIPEITKEVEIN